MQNIKLSYSTPDYKIEGNKVICTIHFYFKKEIIKELLLLRNKKLLSVLSNNFNIILDYLKEERNKPFNYQRLQSTFNKYGFYFVIEDSLSGTKVRGCSKVKIRIIIIIIII